MFEDVANGFITPTLIPFIRSNQAKPDAIVVFPISVSVPVINTPCNFLGLLIEFDLVK